MQEMGRNLPALFLEEDCADAYMITAEKWEPIDNFSNYVKPEYKGVPKDFKNGHLL